MPTYPLQKLCLSPSTHTSSSILYPRLLPHCPLVPFRYTPGAKTQAMKFSLWRNVAEAACCLCLCLCLPLRPLVPPELDLRPGQSRLPSLPLAKHATQLRSQPADKPRCRAAPDKRPPNWLPNISFPNKSFLVVDFFSFLLHPRPCRAVLDDIPPLPSLTSLLHAALPPIATHPIAAQSLIA